jgi:3-deoxy-D-manno-octulosonic-acid transferase
MYLIYTFLLYAALIVASPYFAFRFRRYLPTLKDRFGYLSVPRLNRSIWIHAVSVGEVRAVQRLVMELRLLYPGKALVVSTATPAGQGLVRATPGLADHAFYFPLDLPSAIRRTLERVNPELVLIAETEIWPNFLRICRLKDIRVVMVNGRISDRSLPRYRLVKPWLKRVLRDYEVLGMQSELDRQRIESVGADSGRVTVFGNLKYDAAAALKPLATELAACLRLNQPLWIAASTMEGEEEQILDALPSLLTRFPGLKLLIAPRHPRRFDEVARLIQSRGYQAVRRSSLGGLENEKAILLLDSIGELPASFEFSSVVFIGGTLVERGGHNIIEPAVFSKPIVFGPHMENFREICDLFLEQGAAVQVNDGGQLADAVANLLADAQTAARLGANARRVVEQNAGATARVLEYLK